VTKAPIERWAFFVYQNVQNSILAHFDIQKTKLQISAALLLCTLRESGSMPQSPKQNSILAHFDIQKTKLQISAALLLSAFKYSG
jgi:hypothetical protein